MSVSEREIGVEQARANLGRLVDDAAVDGHITYLTRRGRRFAAIVPLSCVEETAMHAADITATLDRPASDGLDTSGWDWSEAATEAWLEAAKDAGVAAELHSIEVPNVNYDAAIVATGKALWLLSVDSHDQVTARPHLTCVYGLCWEDAGDQSAWVIRIGPLDDEDGEWTHWMWHEALIEEDRSEAQQWAATVLADEAGHEVVGWTRDGLYTWIAQFERG